MVLKLRCSLHSCSKRDNNKLVVVTKSKSHLSPKTEEYINSLELNGRELIEILKGSSLKLCMVAEGVVDIYPRLTPRTMELATNTKEIINNCYKVASYKET